MRTQADKNILSLQKYYRFHSVIYDYTRWTFLFGRRETIKEIAKLAGPKNILEVGCGTGSNLITLHNFFPTAKLTGIDISTHMLKKCEMKLLRSGADFKLLNKSYDCPISGDFDLVLFSYCLSMINPGWELAISTAKQDLKNNSLIAVVDFEGSKFNFFKNWMALNHVKMEYHLPQKLEQEFKIEKLFKHNAFMGLWSYFIFIGRKQA